MALRGWKVGIARIQSWHCTDAELALHGWKVGIARMKIAVSPLPWRPNDPPKGYKGYKRVKRVKKYFGRNTHSSVSVSPDLY